MEAFPQFQSLIVEKIAEAAGVTSLGAFFPPISDGEIQIIEESVRNSDIYIIQSTNISSQ